MEAIQTVTIDDKEYGLVPKDKLYIKTSGDGLLTNFAFLSLLGYIGMKAIAGLTGAALVFMLGFLCLMGASLLLDIFALFKKD